MPGRYFIIPPPDTASKTLIPADFDQERVRAAFASARYNIAPTQTAPVLRIINGSLVTSDMRWGFAPRWMKDPGKAQINARSETVFEKRMFSQAARTQRCLVPASGWYEWQPTNDGKQPWALHMPDYAPFAFAGLWTAGNGKGAPEENFLTLTTAPSSQVASIHHRMPVILDAEGCRRWLDPAAKQEQLSPLLGSWQGELAMHRVSTQVSNPKHHGPECLEEVK